MASERGDGPLAVWQAGGDAESYEEKVALSRRAWIETMSCTAVTAAPRKSPLRGGVDPKVSRGEARLG